MSGYRTHSEWVHEWAESAASKLRAEGVDQGDLAAVRQALSECVGGPRLFDFWRAVYCPQLRLEEVTG